MGTKWDKLFGEEYYIKITNEERRYLGLDPMLESWDISQFYNKGNLLNDVNKDMRAELFKCLGLAPDATFDDFALQFHGLTKKEIMEKQF